MSRSRGWRRRWTMRARSDLERLGGGISGGQGKMVALGRALMIARKVLLLDEPFQGLAPALDYARTLRSGEAGRRHLRRPGQDGRAGPGSHDCAQGIAS